MLQMIGWHPRTPEDGFLRRYVIDKFTYTVLICFQIPGFAQGDLQNDSNYLYAQTIVGWHLKPEKAKKTHCLRMMLMALDMILDE